MLLQVPIFGRFMPGTVNKESPAKPLSTASASVRSSTNASLSHHDPSAVKEPAGKDEHKYQE